MDDDGLLLTDLGAWSAVESVQIYHDGLDAEYSKRLLRIGELPASLLV